MRKIRLPRDHPRKRARNAGDGRPSLAHGVGRARHLCRPCFAAICRSWRARLCLPHGSAPSADPCQWTNHDDVARRDGARDTARQWHPARFGMRRPGALYHLPHPRGQWASGAARTGGTGSRGACAHRGDGGCAARLPDTAYGRYFGDATACRRLQRRRWPRARRHGGQRTPGHGRVHRPARLHDARRGEDALRCAVHPQSVLQRDDQGARRHRWPLFEFYRRWADGALWARCAGTRDWRSAGVAWRSAKC